MLPTKKEAEAAVKLLLAYWGEDPEREGLVGTPDRVVRAIREFSAGYDQNPKDILKTTFAEAGGYNQMIVTAGIEFMSHCEHHMVPFVGTVDIVYLPKGPVVGLSKFGRLVEIFARRLQIQEKMTQQIGEAIMEHVNPQSVMVRVSAKHMCMGHRGVKKPGAVMVTQYLGGELRSDPLQRAEALSILDRAKG